MRKLTSKHWKKCSSVCQTPTYEGKCLFLASSVVFLGYKIYAMAYTLCKTRPPYPPTCTTAISYPTCLLDRHHSDVKWKWTATRPY